MFFKLVLVDRLENLVSDRRLVEHCALRLDILYFLSYEVDEDLPWHSTVSRTRQLYPAAVFERLFDHVFAQCVTQGLVAGDTQAVDSAPVKANASLYSLCEKQPLAAIVPRMQLAGEPDQKAPSQPSAAVVDTPAHVLRRVATRQAQHRTGHFNARRPRARLVSNKTHYSPTDPDARISVKLGKARALNYLCSLAVDTAHGVISHVQADLADSRDSVHLPQLVTHLQQRLFAQGLPLQDLVADTNYSNGVNYALLEQQGITPWIPVFGQYKPVVEGFAYDAVTNSFTCPAGKSLPFKSYETSLDSGLFKTYRASTRDCRRCPRKATCAPKTNKRKVTRTAYDPHYRRARVPTEPAGPAPAASAPEYGGARLWQPTPALRPPPGEHAWSGQCPQDDATGRHGLQSEKAAQVPAPTAARPRHRSAQAPCTASHWPVSRKNQE